jgi:hypothetical protein
MHTALPCGSFKQMCFPLPVMILMPHVHCRLQFMPNTAADTVPLI